ncbi:family 16 glycosylhydrolase [Pelagibius litoralis]|uniref:Family 16 glycosylhydrolase n=1 Tax=Pelagibius litoralis TaxID=374515 RepID=A0A967EXB0_9PROT|nr:family 16 glycosylhydrolase [Pelagibius litoralis]NIA68615.1 family 16 glycosylhydrolase [Pelagibius litoralis]
MSTILNAKGKSLFYSASSVNHHTASAGTPELHGSATHDSLWGDSALQVSLYGGAGDDIYHLYSGRNRAFESADQGTDTVKTWMSYQLSAEIENLTVTGSGRYAFGNETDNIITGGAGRQTLDGRGGDDVLKGNGGADIFAVTQGNGSDLIVDFSADDVLRLTGYDIFSFDALMARSSQSGTDLHFDLGGGEILVLADTTAGDLDAGQFQLGLDLAGLVPTFEDGFDSLDLWNGQNGTWDTNYWWGAPNGSTLPNNNELQWYIDHDYAPTAGVNPFSIEDGVLTITAAEAAPAIQPQIDGFEYTSGMLTSYETFAQTYGYFEIRADMPEAQGLWPTFWLLPADGGWPPELDVIELRGQNPHDLILTAHSEATGDHTIDGRVAHVADVGGFHDYGVLWGPEEIVWYYDGTEVGRTATPDDMHEDMYLIVNLAVGGIAGQPDAGQAILSDMKVDYIRAYSLDDVMRPDGPGTPGNDTIVGTAEADRLFGGAGDDLIEGKGGDDRLFGQDGNDVLRGNGGTDTIDGGNGNDTVEYHPTSANLRIDLAEGTARAGSHTETLVSIENAVSSYGKDTLAGDAGDNVLRSGHGRDRLIGHEGDDTLSGGSGGDIFIFRKLNQDGGDGHDRITDFHKASDKLAFRDLIDSDQDGDIDLDDLLGSVASVSDAGAGGDVVVAFGNGASLTFAGLGNGQMDSITDLVRDADSQIFVS